MARSRITPGESSVLMRCRSALEKFQMLDTGTGRIICGRIIETLEGLFFVSCSLPKNPVCIHDL